MGINDLDLGADFDLGQDWDQDIDTSNKINAKSPDAPVMSSWAIVLGTFTDADHRDQAASFLQSLPAIEPRLASSRVQPRSGGSMVVYGAYDGPDDPKAQRDLKSLRELKRNGRPALGRIMIARMQTANAATMSPLNLLSARRQYPNVDPLYTLDVAVWIAETIDTRSVQGVQTKAEAYVRQLRTQNMPAYFYHDPDKGISTVTVGLWDRHALDPQSGLMAPEIEELIRLFGARLVNGEPLQVPFSEKNPSLGSRTQKPALVLVPRR